MIIQNKHAIVFYMYKFYVSLQYKCKFYKYKSYFHIQCIKDKPSLKKLELNTWDY